MLTLLAVSLAVLLGAACPPAVHGHDPQVALVVSSPPLDSVQARNAMCKYNDSARDRTIPIHKTN